MTARDVGGGVSDPGTLDQTSPTAATEPNGSLAVSNQLLDEPIPF